MVTLSVVLPSPSGSTAMAGIRSGDSGGAAYSDGAVVGVASNADDLGANFSDVAAHRAFIDAILSQKETITN